MILLSCNWNILHTHIESFINLLQIICNRSSELSNVFFILEFIYLFAFRFFILMSFCYCHITCYTPLSLLSSFLFQEVHCLSEESHRGCWLHGASACQQQTNVWHCALMSKTSIIGRLHVRCTALCTCLIYIEGLRTVCEGHLVDVCYATCVLGVTGVFSHL